VFRKTEEHIRGAETPSFGLGLNFLKRLFFQAPISFHVVSAGGARSDAHILLLNYMPGEKG
jgi:hypothetical protein